MMLRLTKVGALGMCVTGGCLLAMMMTVQAEEHNTWKVILQSEVKHAVTVIGFLNESMGITAGYAGETHYTADGGQTWPKANNQSMCRFGLDILNDKLAWTVGNGGNVRKSMDGGQNWTALTNTAVNASLVSFVNEQTGWGASGNELVATTDGGTTWTDVVLPESIQTFAAISLRTANDGYILDKSSTLYMTQDGGKTWSSKALPPLENKMVEIFANASHMEAVRFTDAEHGIVILTLKNEGIVALRTADGGATWTKEPVAPKAMIGSVFLTHDGTVLTLTSASKKIIVFRYQPS